MTSSASATMRPWSAGGHGPGGAAAAERAAQSSPAMRRAAGLVEDNAHWQVGVEVGGDGRCSSVDRSLWNARRPLLEVVGVGLRGLIRIARLVAGSAPEMPDRPSGRAPYAAPLGKAWGTWALMYTRRSMSCGTDSPTGVIVRPPEL